MPWQLFAPGGVARAHGGRLCRPTRSVRSARSAPHPLRRPAEALEPRTLLASTLVPVTDVRDLVYDDTRHLLYVTTAGRVERYDAASGNLLAPFPVGTDPVGADITADGSALYVTEDVLHDGKGVVHKLDLAGGVVRDLEYTPASGETGGWDVAIAADGRALLTTQTVPNAFSPTLRLIDLASDTVSTTLFSIPQRSLVTRGADRSMVLLQQFNARAVNVYHSAFGGFGSSRPVPSGPGRAPGAVSRDGQFLAYQVGNSTAVMEGDSAAVRTVPLVDGGMVFDPKRDLFYGVESSTDSLVAFDTHSWAEKFRVPVGEDVTEAAPITRGMMAIDGDATKVFLATQRGVRAIDLPTPTGDAATIRLSGSPSLIRAGARAAHALPLPVLRGRAGVGAILERRP
jgi:DNA-binding beta-propeller fold protein YncE